jgi:galactonate dehydratase
VKAVREALGDEVDICLDYHGRNLSTVEAIKLAKAIEQYNPLFLEEPAMSENPNSLVEIKHKTTVPIAAGERCISRDLLREIIEKEAVHILQPEPIANGGIFENVKWAAMAEIHHILIAPHHACSALSLLACAHLDACIPNFLIQECNVDLNSSFTKEIFINLPKMKDGYLLLPDTPGLGIELNEEAALKYQYKPYDRPVILKEDGSIGLE